MYGITTFASSCTLFFLLSQLGTLSNAFVEGFLFGSVYKTALTKEKGERLSVSGYESLSVSGLYIVAIKPERGGILIGQMQRWVVSVNSADGEPVYPIKMSIGGGMEAHGHGLPTQPRLIAYGGKGDYLIDGVRFNMAGVWRLSFLIESGLGVDRVDFDIQVDF